MKAIIKRKPDIDKEWYQGLDLAEKPEPVLKNPDDIKIKVLAAAVCGTDIGIYKGTPALKNSLLQLASPDVIVGHEFCGQIVEIGEEAKKQIVSLLYSRKFLNKKVQDYLDRHDVATLANDPDLLKFLQENFYASAEMHIICGKCRQCRLGEGHACQHTVIKGLHADGAFTSYVVIPASNLRLYAIGEIPLEIIAFMDAIGNATHTAQAAEVKDKDILILGAGVQGLMAVAIARKMGAKKIFITDASNDKAGLTKEKLEASKFSYARFLGADYCLDTATPEGKQELYDLIQKETEQTGVDAVLEMSGSYYALQDGFKNVRMGGTIALLGLSSGTLAVDFSKDIIFRGITIKGVIGRRIFSTWDLMYDLLTAGLAETIVKSGLITHQLPLEKFNEGFDALLSGSALKVILKP